MPDPFSVPPEPHSQTTQRKKYLRIASWVILLIFLSLFIVLSSQLVTEAQVQYDDYTIYWSAGRLNISGGNPYGLDDLLHLEMEAGRYTDVPMMFWNPPWTLPLVMPLSLLPYPISRTIWYLITLAIIIGTVHWSWVYYGGRQRWHWLAWGIGLTFDPALQVMKYGQISTIPVIGVIGFMIFLQRRKYLLAGMLLALIAIKPHTYYLLGTAVILWSMTQRKWNVLTGGAIALGGAVGIAWLVNPRVLQQYVYALTYYPPEQWATATLGGALRLAFGVKHFWLQFIPSLIGLIGFLIYWWIKRRAWDWSTELPIIVVISAATAAYGWMFDNIATLIAIIYIFIMLFERGNWPLKIIVSLSYLVLDIILVLVNKEQFWFWWAPSTLAIWYLFSNWALTHAKTNISLLKSQ